MNLPLKQAGTGGIYTYRRPTRQVEDKAPVLVFWRPLFIRQVLEYLGGDAARYDLQHALAPR